jgi:hypothetical protein
MTTPAPVLITELVNLTLDKLYRQTAIPVLEQIDRLCNAPNSPLQNALRELDAETERLALAGEPLHAQNAVLEKTLRTVQQVYEATAMLIEANAGRVQASGAGVAIPAVTAKVFPSLTQGQSDILSPQATQRYLDKLQQSNIPWRVP